MLLKDRYTFYDNLHQGLFTNICLFFISQKKNHVKQGPPVFCFTTCAVLFGVSMRVRGRVRIYSMKDLPYLAYE